MSYDDLILNDEGRLCLPTGEPYTGATEDFYEDGQIMNRETFLNGVMHGLQQWWHGNGQLGSEEVMCLGQGHGYRREWYSNGRPKLESLSEHGFKISHKQWDEEGNLTHDSRYPYDQSYSVLLRWRAEARAAGFGSPPEGVDPGLLPP